MKRTPPAAGAHPLSGMPGIMPLLHDILFWITHGTPPYPVRGWAQGGGASPPVSNGLSFEVGIEFFLPIPLVVLDLRRSQGVRFRSPPAAGAHLLSGIPGIMLIYRYSIWITPYTAYPVWGRVGEGDSPPPIRIHRYHKFTHRLSQTRETLRGLHSGQSRLPRYVHHPVYLILWHVPQRNPGNHRGGGRYRGHHTGREGCCPGERDS